MNDLTPRPAPRPLACPVFHFVARTLEHCDVVAVNAEDLAERACRRTVARGGARRSFAVLRTRTALQQTESALAQTAHSLQRTASALSALARPA